MNCRDADFLIQQALDGALSPTERARLDAHLAACPACRAAWDEYRRLARAAADWARRPTASDPGEEFTARVMARIAARPARSRTSFWLLLLLAGAGLASLAALSFAFWPAVSRLSAPATALLPQPQAAVGIPDWLLANLRALPADAASLLATLTKSLVVPSWAAWALVAALVANGLLYARAVRTSRGRHA